MKFDRSKTYPYPVLRPFSDDYSDAEFQALAEFTIQASAVEVSCSYITSSAELAEQVLMGNAKYVTVISCRETYYRHVIQTDQLSVKVQLDPDVLRGEVDVHSFIVAVKDINGFKSEDINKEFGRDSFFFSPGDVLAQEENHCIYVDRELFKPLSSVFNLVKNESLSNAEWRIGLDQDNVNIEVSALMKESIDNSRSSSMVKSVLINSIYMSSVIHAIQMLKESDDYDQFKWARVMSHQIHNSNLDIVGTDSYVLAQKLMKQPLGLLNTYVFTGSSND